MSCERQEGKPVKQKYLDDHQSAGPARKILEDKRKEENGEWVIKRQYEVLSKLGKGGFAKVYLARDIETKKEFALKIIKKSSIEKESFKQKMNQEIRFQKSLCHENVVKYYSSFEDSHSVYIVLEYCSNQTFKELLDRRRRLTEIEVKSHMLQIIASLKYIHSQGIIHREQYIAFTLEWMGQMKNQRKSNQFYFAFCLINQQLYQYSLKIANIFLTSDMGVRIADFGLSAQLSKQPNARRKTVCGTPNYIAPEVLKNDGHDFRVDNWALGVIVFTLLVGKPPFEEKEAENTLRNIKANRFSFQESSLQTLSTDAIDLVNRILVPNPAVRLTLDQMLEHPFLKQSPNNIIPSRMPVSTLALPPTSTFLESQNRKENNKEKDQKIKGNIQQWGKLTSTHQQISPSVELVTVVDILKIKQTGIGYLLSDGSCGVLLMGCDDVIQLSTSNLLYIFKRKQQGQQHERREINVSCGMPVEGVDSQDIDRYNILVKLQKHFQKQLPFWKPTKLTSISQEIIYVKERIKAKKVVLYRFSNKDMQALFSNNQEVIIIPRCLCVRVKDHTGNIQEYQSQRKDGLPRKVRDRLDFIRKATLDNAQFKQSQGYYITPSIFPQDALQYMALPLRENLLDLAPLKTKDEDNQFLQTVKFPKKNEYQQVLKQGIYSSHQSQQLHAQDNSHLKDLAVNPSQRA